MLRLTCQQILTRPDEEDKLEVNNPLRYAIQNPLANVNNTVLIPIVPIPIDVPRKVSFGLRYWFPAPKNQNEGPKPQILEKEKLQILKRKLQFWPKSWSDGLFGRLKRPKWKEMKAQKTIMKRNESLKSQNKMKWNENPKGQKERKWRPKRPKWKEMNHQKAKMKGNEGPRGQNQRKWSLKRQILEKKKLQNLKGNCNFRPNPDQMAFLEGSKSQNERKWILKGQNETKWKPKRPKGKEIEKE